MAKDPTYEATGQEARGCVVPTPSLRNLGKRGTAQGDRKYMFVQRDCHWLEVRGFKVLKQPLTEGKVLPPRPFVTLSLVQFPLNPVASPDPCTKLYLGIKHAIQRDFHSSPH
jgi:hypothetical protein